jgi:predicted transcriptional regulator
MRPCFFREIGHYMVVTAKAHVLELIQRLPDEASYGEITRKVELVAGIREAQDQIARGEGISAQEILKELPAWITKS